MFRSLAAAFVAIGLLVVAPVAANAWQAQTTADLNVRYGPSVR